MGSTGSPVFGAWLRERLGSRSYGQVAEYVGVSTSTVSRWVTGASGPEYRNLVRLASYLGVDHGEIEAMLPSETPPTPPPTDPAARSLIREVVLETLAQMGHPRVAAEREPPLPQAGPYATVAEAISALDTALQALDPADQEVMYGPEFRRGLKAARRRALAAEAG